MVLVLEMINPMYLIMAGGVFMIIVGCACYGCHDILYSQAVTAAGVVACNVSDCEIPDVHEQHVIEDKGESLWSKKAWGMEPDEAYYDPITGIPQTGFEVSYDGGGGGRGGDGGGIGVCDLGAALGGCDDGGGDGGGGGE